MALVHEQVLALVEEVLADPGRAWATIGRHLVNRLIGATVMLVTQTDSVARTVTILVWYPPEALGPEPPPVTPYPSPPGSDFPLVAFYEATGSMAVLRAVPDVVSLEVWRATSAYQLAHGRFGEGLPLVIPLTNTVVGQRSVVLFKDRLNFSEEQVEAGRELQPLLIALDGYVQRRAAAPQVAPHLSAGEQAVLAVLAAGVSDPAAIASRLGVSQGTVAARLARLVLWLGTADPVGMVLAAQAAGLVAPPEPVDVYAWLRRRI